MLKNGKFNIFAIANQYSFKRFLYAEITLRDKLKIDMNILDDKIKLFGNSTSRVIYVFQTKMIKNQIIPPKHNSQFIIFNPISKTYNYEITTFGIIIECGDRVYKRFQSDIKENSASNIEEILCEVLENFLYNYNFSVNGCDYIRIEDMCVGGAVLYLVYRDKKTGLFNNDNIMIKTSWSILKNKDENTLQYQKVIDSKIPIWKYYINKVKYLYSTNESLECIINSAVAMESYVIWKIKCAQKYEKYIKDKAYNFNKALMFAKNEKIISEKEYNSLHKGYSKLDKMRCEILHGVIDSPIIKKNDVKRVYEVIVNVFSEIEESYCINCGLYIANERFDDNYNRMDRVISEYNNGKYEKAIDELSQNIEHDYFIDISLFYRGKCYSEISKIDEAISDFKHCIKNNYNIIECYNLLALEYAKKGEYKEAIKEYKKAIITDGSYSEYYYNMGLQYAKLKDYDKAIESFKGALKIRKEGIYYYSMGVSWYYKKQFDEAIKNYNKAIKMSPDNAMFLYERAALYEFLNNPKKAEQDITNCLRYYKDEPDIAFVKERLYQIGKLYFKEKKYKDAIRMYNKCIKLDEKSDASYQGKVCCYRELKDYKKAKENA